MAKHSEPGETDFPSAAATEASTATTQPAAQGVVDQARQQARTLASEAKEQTAELAGQAKQQVSTLMSEQKDRAAEGLGTLAGALRQAARQLAGDDFGGGIGRYATRAADQMDSMSKYVRGTDFTTMLRDTGQFARRRPEVFLGGTFLTGLLAARFLKASTRHPEQPDMPVGGW